MTPLAHFGSLVVSAALLLLLAACKPAPAPPVAQPVETRAEAPTPVPADLEPWDAAAWAATLPWAFTVDESTPPEPAEDIDDNSRRYLLTSNEAVGGAAGGATTLRLTVDHTVYPSTGQAVRAFEALGASANPDTGLSYAWDLVVLHSDEVFRLHAPCLVSEANFDHLAGLFLESVTRNAPENALLLRCRCGGGCSG